MNKKVPIVDIGQIASGYKSQNSCKSWILIKDIKIQLIEILKKKGFKNITDAVGSAQSWVT